VNSQSADVSVVFDAAVTTTSESITLRSFDDLRRVQFYSSRGMGRGFTFFISHFYTHQHRVAASI